MRANTRKIKTNDNKDIKKLDDEKKMRTTNVFLGKSLSMRYCFRSEVSLSRDSPALTMLEARTLKKQTSIFEAAPYACSFILFRINKAGKIKL
jgi:hypothetical protein